MSLIQLHVDGQIYSLQPHGGITRCFTNILQCLGERDDVSVTLYHPQLTHGIPPLPGSIDVIRYPAIPRLRPDRIFGKFNNWTQNNAIERMWSKPEHGIFHSTHYSTYESLRIPQVFTLQDMIYELFPECFEPKWHRRHIEDKKRCEKMAKCIIFPSNNTLKDAKKFYRLDNKKTAVIPYAVDSTFCRISNEDILSEFRQKYTSSKPFILFTGARYAHKNFVGLLAAYSRWKERKTYRLLAVGGGPASHDELSILRGLGISKLVDFCPVLNDTDLVIAYNASSAFVMPSLYEGFGFPVLEAIACGTPVAASSTGSTPEVGKNVPIYFDPQNGDQIIGALDEAINLSRYSKRLEDGICQATKRTWEDVASEYVKQYRTVVDTISKRMI